MTLTFKGESVEEPEEELIEQSEEVVEGPPKTSSMTEDYY